MLKQRRILWLLVALTVMGGVVVYLKSRTEEPRYQGRPLTYWVKRLWHPDEGVSEKAQAAIRQMGTNAVPSLIRMLGERDSKWVPVYNRAVRKVGGECLYFRMAGSRSWLAADALRFIGPAAKDAIPFLIANMTNWPTSAGAAGPYVYALEFIGTNSIVPLVNALSHQNPEVRWHAGIALPFHHTNLVLALPQLLELLRAEDAADRETVVRLLGFITTEPQTVVPVLTECLRDKSADVRHRAVYALADFGDAAKAALPSLKDLLRDSDTNVQRAAAVAITNIEPTLRIERPK